MRLDEHDNDLRAEIAAEVEGLLWDALVHDRLPRWSGVTRSWTGQQVLRETWRAYELACKALGAMPRKTPRGHGRGLKP